MNFTIEANHLKENKLNIHVPLDIEILCELFPLLTFEFLLKTLQDYDNNIDAAIGYLSSNDVNNPNVIIEDKVVQEVKDSVLVYVLGIFETSNISVHEIEKSLILNNYDCEKTISYLSGYIPINKRARGEIDRKNKYSLGEFNEQVNNNNKINNYNISNNKIVSESYKTIVTRSPINSNNNLKIDNIHNMQSNNNYKVLTNKSSNEIIEPINNNSNNSNNNNNSSTALICCRENNPNVILRLNEYNEIEYCGRSNIDYKKLFEIYKNNNNKLEHIIDLHGLFIVEAQSLVISSIKYYEINKEFSQNLIKKIVLIFIVGIGLHSRNGIKLLGPAIEKTLRSINYQFTVYESEILVEIVYK